MIKNILLLTLLTSYNVLALDLFKAEYKVYKDGKIIGTSSIELAPVDNSQNKSLDNSALYKIIDTTKGTHGMASFLGFKRSEETIFNDNNSHFIPQSYEMKQKVAFKKRQSKYKVDINNNTAKGNYKGDKWENKVPKVFTTPNLVSLALSRDICAGKMDNLNYKVLKKGTIQDYQFKITSEKDGIIEVDKVHSKPSRITKTWLDTNQQCIPVRTYHKEKDEDALESKLEKLSFN